MIKPLALTAALLILAGCNASNPTAPTAVAPAPSFDHATTGCLVAEGATAANAAPAGVAAVITDCGLGN
jgi:uncharacterized lipoprotein YajG